MLSAGPLEAAFAPGLGMAGVSLRHEGDELLDRQAGLRAYARTGAVMGIPLLYPWADRLAAHGYALGGRDVPSRRDPRSCTARSTACQSTGSSTPRPTGGSRRTTLRTCAPSTRGPMRRRS